MVRALQDGEGGLGAEDVLIGVMRAGHADGAEERNAVHDDDSAGVAAARGVGPHVTRTGLGPVSEGNAHEVMPAISR